jgi:U3 small nucleolar RNA-associated protein 18
VVSIYNLNESLLTTTKHPKPLKTFMNLTTPCTSLKFNHSSEILAASSSHGENACKLIHTGSMTVFANFPLHTADKSSIHTSMRMVESIDFSLNSGYFAIGNNKGNALLYR